MTKPCIIAQSTLITLNTELEILLHAGISCDIQSQYSWGGRNTCSDSVCTHVCAKGEVDEKPTEIPPLHHWVNGTTDMSCNFTAASWRVTLKPTHEHIAHQSEWGVLCCAACTLKNNGIPPPLKCILAHLECLEWVEMGMKNKKNPFGFMHLSRSLTDCDLPLLGNGKETARPWCHKMTQSGR